MLNCIAKANGAQRTITIDAIDAHIYDALKSGQRHTIVGAQSQPSD